MLMYSYTACSWKPPALDTLDQKYSIFKVRGKIWHQKLNKLKTAPDLLYKSMSVDRTSDSEHTKNMS